ncbi:hypothetical protein CAEBREN_24161 [Caenorhabditis brenneri]|uniref:Uncharacterized protein n=1 Tax=Caenorhabditis brenneri TaxID=135651 RepID=G0NDG5_CAEBE|nr:hypothetical protein CAEBREN_24161 [Caenorhabditis brenneri]
MDPPTPAPIHHHNQMRVSPATFPSPAEPNSSKKQIKAEPASPPSTPPPAMVTSSTVQAGHQSLLKTSSAPSPTPPAVVQSYGAPNHSQNQTMPLPTMVPPCMGLSNFQYPIIMAPLFIVAHPGQNFAMNQHWNPYGMWNTHQIGGGAPVPQPPQWNMIQGAAPFGQPGSPLFNGAGPSSQQGPNGANFFLRC